MIRFFLFFSLLFLAWSCNNAPSAPQQEEAHAHDHTHGHQAGQDANAHMHQQDFEDLVSNFESPERLQWQKPDKVVQWMGDLQGKVVADIGSGTGFFSFRLVKAGARVIAIDIDDRFQEVIQKRKIEEDISDEALQTRKTSPDAPGLQTAEADAVLLVNTYHHIENRASYFQEVRAGIKPDGALYIVDFIQQETEHGPPVSMRLSHEQVQQELQQAGFTHFEKELKLLAEQYIIKAWSE